MKCLYLGEQFIVFNYNKLCVYFLVSCYFSASEYLCIILCVRVPYELVSQVYSVILCMMCEYPMN